MGQVRDCILTRFAPYHIFVVAETWLGTSIPDDIVQIKDYTLVRRDRNISGGEVLYICDLLKIIFLAQSDTTRSEKSGVPEYIICSLQRGNSPSILTYVIYFPPHVALMKNIDLWDQLRKHCFDCNHKVIMGDLNVDVWTNSDDSKLLYKLKGELLLRMPEHGPMHFTSTSATWIVVILVDDNDPPRETQNEPTAFHNGHNIISVVLEIPIPSMSNKTITNGEYKNIDSSAPVNLFVHCD